MTVLDSRGVYADQITFIRDGGAADIQLAEIELIGLHLPSGGGWFNPFNNSIAFHDALAAENKINKLVDDQLFLLEGLIGRAPVQEYRSVLRQILRLTNVVPDATLRTLEHVLNSTNWHHYDPYIQKLGTRSSQRFFAMEPRERELERIASMVSHSLDGMLADGDVEHALCGAHTVGNDDARIIHVQLDCIASDVVATAFLRRAALVKAMATLDERAANRTNAAEFRLVLGQLDDFVDEAGGVRRLKAWAQSRQVVLDVDPVDIIPMLNSECGTIDGSKPVAVIEAAE